MTPKVTVVIPVYNQYESLRTTLLYFNKQTFPLDQFEVIVIDDGSTVPVEETIGKEILAYKLIVFRQANSGRSAARNAGVKLSSGKLLVFCDADRIPEDDFIQAHVDFHLQNDSVAAFGCPWDCFWRLDKIYHSSGEDMQVIKKFSRRSEYYAKIIVLFSGIHTDSPVAWSTFLVGNSSIKKRHFLETDGFDEKFKSWGFEHFEFALQLQRKNIRICHLERASNYHIPHPRNSEQLYANIRESIHLLKHKYPGERVELLEDFLLGEISLQEFEQGYGGSISKTIAGVDPVFLNQLKRR